MRRSRRRTACPPSRRRRASPWALSGSSSVTGALVASCCGSRPLLSNGVPQDTLVCRGRVFDREGKDGRYLIDLDVWAENQRGELVIRGSATVRLFFSADDEQRARAGQSPLVVNVARQSIVVASPPPPKPAVAKAKNKPAKRAPPKPQNAEGSRQDVETKEEKSLTTQCVEGR